TDRGVNAVAVAARIIGFLERMAAERVAAADPGNGFSPPYSTIHVGVIRGGTALNIIPRTCSFEWEIRPLPDDDPQPIIERLEAFVAEEILPAMHAVSPKTGVTTEALVWIPAL